MRLKGTLSCNICGVIKTRANTSVSSGRFNSYCKECNSIYVNLNTSLLQMTEKQLLNNKAKHQLLINRYDLILENQDKSITELTLLIRRQNEASRKERN